MANLLEQLPTLLGVVLGAAGTMFATTLADRFRWKRELAVRWDERRFTSYMAFAEALKDVQVVLSRVTAARNFHSVATPIDHDSALALLQGAHGRRTLTWESVLMLGDQQTVAAARHWRDCVYGLQAIAFDSASDVDAWIASVDDVDKARDQLYVAARNGLGVGGSVAQLPFLREQRQVATVLASPAKRECVAESTYSGGDLSLNEGFSDLGPNDGSRARSCRDWRSGRAADISD